jgi:hypothetical protein
MSVLGRSPAGPRPPHGGRLSASVVETTWHRWRYRRAARRRHANRGIEMRAHYGTPGVLCASLVSRSATGSSQARCSTGSGIRPHPGGEARRPRRAFGGSQTNPSLSGVATEARDARVAVRWIADALQPDPTAGAGASSHRESPASWRLLRRRLPRLSRWSPAFRPVVARAEAKYRRSKEPACWILGVRAGAAQ